MSEKQTVGRSTDEVMAAVQAKRKAESLGELFTIDSSRMIADVSREWFRIESTGRVVISPDINLDEVKKMDPAYRHLLRAMVDASFAEADDAPALLPTAEAMQQLIDSAPSAAEFQQHTAAFEAWEQELARKRAAEAPAPLPTDEQIASLLQENERLKRIEVAAILAVEDSGKVSFNKLCEVLGLTNAMVP